MANEKSVEKGKLGIVFVLFVRFYPVPDIKNRYNELQREK